MCGPFLLFRHREASQQVQRLDKYCLLVIEKKMKKKMTLLTHQEREILLASLSSKYLRVLLLRQWLRYHLGQPDKEIVSKCFLFLPLTEIYQYCG